MGSKPLPQVDNTIYEAYGDRWYTAYDDPIALLRAESKAILPWVLEKIHAHPAIATLPLLDVGCGAGFLSNALAREGYTVTGLDLSPESLETARRHDEGKTVRYRLGNAYELPFADQSFGVVTAMDFLEHVDDPHSVIAEISRVLKPGGIFLYHTFNRNPLANFVVIKLVDWFVKNTPKDMHVIHLFLKPQEVADFCQQRGMLVESVCGIRPDFFSIPLRNFITGVVPESLKFKIVRSTAVSYMGCAVREN